MKLFTKAYILLLALLQRHHLRLLLQLQLVHVFPLILSCFLHIHDIWHLPQHVLQLCAVESRPL